MSASPQDNTPASPPQRKPPFWLILGILLLFGGGYAWTTYHSRSGPEITWLNNVDAALAQAAAEKKRVFLVLYSQGEGSTAALDRTLFPLRTVREILVQMVCCRIEVRPTDSICARYDCSTLPHCYVLDSHGTIMESRLAGQVEELQFTGYVKPH